MYRPGASGLFIYFYDRSDPGIRDAFSLETYFQFRQRELGIDYMYYVLCRDTICVSKLKLMRNIRIDG